MRVTLERDSTAEVGVRIEVSDTGIGMSEQTQQRLFQPFTQADGSATRQYGGTGLGLVISKQLVELMGGEIGVQSTPGQGSTFWFTVRLKRPAVLPFAAPRAAQPGKAAGYKPRRQWQILVVDDNPVNHRVTRLQLEQLGLKEAFATRGAEALRMLERDGYDLVFMDCQMPALDGYATTREIRHREIASRRHIWIVALTAHAMTGDREKCLAAGMDDYLSKPVTLERMRATLHRFEQAQVAAPAAAASQ